MITQKAESKKSHWEKKANIGQGKKGDSPKIMARELLSWAS